MELIEKGKDKVKDFIYDLFNPLILPYVYKLSPKFVHSFLLYLINEDFNIYISKDGTYSIAYKISADTWEEFSEFISKEEFLRIFDYAGFSYTTSSESIDSEIVFWATKSMSIELGDIEMNFSKTLKARDMLELKMKNYGLFYSRLPVDYLMNYIEKISWYKKMSEYTETKPISLSFKASPLVLRDELCYSPKDIYFTYSVKSTYEDSLINTLSKKPFSMEIFEPPINSDVVLTNTFLINYEDKYKRKVCSFLLIKFLDGVKKFKDSDYYKYSKEYKSIDFSLFEEKVSLEVLGKAPLCGVNFQREQKNLLFFYGVSCLPFNLSFGVDLSSTRRDFSIHMEV